MTRPPLQLPLDLPLKPRFGAEDFLVSSSNEAAYAMMECWPDWPTSALLLVGPSGSGKSHLGAIWSQRSHASVLSISALGQTDPLALTKAPALLIEDLDKINRLPDETETALFHLLNAAKERSLPLVLTSGLDLDRLHFKTADVRSRLRAFGRVEIGAPDDALLRAVIVKLFVDRQLVVDVGVVEYLALHLERSLEAVRNAVSLLDRQALALGRRITRAMAADIVKKIDDSIADAHH